MEFPVLTSSSAILCLFSNSPKPQCPHCFCLSPAFSKWEGIVNFFSSHLLIEYFLLIIYYFNVLCEKICKMILSVKMWKSTTFCSLLTVTNLYRISNKVLRISLIIISVNLMLIAIVWYWTMKTFHILIPNIIFDSTPC